MLEKNYGQKSGNSAPSVQSFRSSITIDREVVDLVG